MSLVQGQSLIIMTTIIKEQMTEWKKQKKMENRTMDNSLMLEICSVAATLFLDKITTCCSAAVGVENAYDRNLHFLSGNVYAIVYVCICALYGSQIWIKAIVIVIALTLTFC